MLKDIAYGRWVHTLWHINIHNRLVTDIHNQLGSTRLVAHTLQLRCYWKLRSNLRFNTEQDQFVWHNHMSQHGWINMSILRCGMKLPVHSQTSTMRSMEVGNLQVNSSYIFQACDYLSMLGSKCQFRYALGMPLIIFYVVSTRHWMFTRATWI